MMSTSQQYLCIKKQTAAKTGLNAKGAISYAVIRDAQAQEVYFCLLSNEAGGYYSQEPVSVTAIAQCLANIDLTGVIPSKAFKAAFVGKSANNAGFLAAALRQESLLHPNPDAAHQHVLGHDLQAWKEDMLKADGEPFDLPTKKKDEAVNTHITHHTDDAATGHSAKGKRAKKSVAQRLDRPSSNAEDESHGRPA